MACNIKSVRFSENWLFTVGRAYVWESNRVRRVQYVTPVGCNIESTNSPLLSTGRPDQCNLLSSLRCLLGSSYTVLSLNMHYAYGLNNRTPGPLTGRHVPGFLRSDLGARLVSESWTGMSDLPSLISPETSSDPYSLHLRLDSRLPPSDSWSGWVTLGEAKFTAIHVR